MTKKNAILTAALVCTAIAGGASMRMQIGEKTRHAPCAPTCSERVQQTVIVTQTEAPAEPDIARLTQALRYALASGDGAIRLNGLRNILPEICAREPSALREMLADVKEHARRMELIRQIARILSVQSPSDARAWIASLPQGEEQDGALEEYCELELRGDPLAAMQTAEEAGLLGRSQEAATRLVTTWARQDWQGALDWTCENAAGSQRETILATIVFIAAQEVPPRAAEMVATRMISGVRQEEAAISVIHQWAMSDLKGAAQWAADFPAGETKQRAEREIQGLAGNLGSR